MSIEGVEIQQSSGNVDIEKSAFLFIGAPKIGKSTLASGFPSPLFLCTSRKEVARLKVPYILVNTHERLEAAVEELVLNRKTKYKHIRTLVLDFADAAWSNCVTAVCKKYKVADPTDLAYGKGSNLVANQWDKVMNSLIGSPYGVIFISHIQQKEVMTVNGTITKTVSTLPDRARKILNPLVSVIGCIEMETIREKTAEGKSVTRKRRMINFDSSEFLEVGDRDGYLPPSIPCYADPIRTFQLMQDYYMGKRVKPDAKGGTMTKD